MSQDKDFRIQFIIRLCCPISGRCLKMMFKTASKSANERIYRCLFQDYLTQLFEKDEQIVECVPGITLGGEDDDFDVKYWCEVGLDQDYSSEELQEIANKYKEAIDTQTCRAVGVIEANKEQLLENLEVAKNDNDNSASNSIEKYCLGLDELFKSAGTFMRSVHLLSWDLTEIHAPSPYINAMSEIGAAKILASINRKLALFDTTTTYSRVRTQLTKDDELVTMLNVESNSIDPDALASHFNGNVRWALTETLKEYDIVIEDNDIEQPYRVN